MIIYLNINQRGFQQRVKLIVESFIQFIQIGLFDKTIASSLDNIINNQLETKTYLDTPENRKKIIHEYFIE